MNDDLKTRFQAIELLILDVDGVLTDGGIIYGEDGVEQKRFHVRDGSALKIWQFVGKKAAIITGRRSKLVEVRAKELGISPCIQGVMDKAAALEAVFTETGISGVQAGAIGDDILDLGVLARCRLAVGVADACPEVRAAAHLVTAAGGGRGAVREVIEQILQAQGLWLPIVEQFRAGSRL